MYPASQLDQKSLLQTLVQCFRSFSSEQGMSLLHVSVRSNEQEIENERMEAKQKFK
jgi:hypothetical protein